MKSETDVSGGLEKLYLVFYSKPQIVVKNAKKAPVTSLATNIDGCVSYCQGITNAPSRGTGIACPLTLACFLLIMASVEAGSETGRHSVPTPSKTKL